MVNEEEQHVLDDNESYCVFLLKRSGVEPTEKNVRECERYFEECKTEEELMEKLSKLTGKTKEHIFNITLEACPECTASPIHTEEKENQT